MALFCIIHIANGNGNWEVERVLPNEKKHPAHH
jgi:hypothetical protein